MEPGWSLSFTTWLIRWRWPLLALAALLAALSWPAARQLQFDRSIENMFAPDDPLLEPYGLLKRVFGGNEIVMATYVDEDLFSQDGIARLVSLRDQLSRIEGVREVLTIDRLMGEKIADPSDPIAERLRELFDGYTHRTNAKTGHTACAAVCMLDPQANSETREAAVAALREIIATMPQGSLAGEPVMVVDGFRYLQEDGERLGYTSTALLMLTIALCFRSLRWMLIPLAVVQLTLLLTRSLLVTVGLKLSMVSSMLTAIVTVVGVATVIHIIVRFRDAREADYSPRDALRAAGSILVVPIFWACATDAVGFGALLQASVGPVSDFGLMMAVGSLLVLVSAALVVPGLALAGNFDDPRRAWGESFLSGGLERLLSLVHWKPKSLALVLLGFSLLAAAGGTRLELESDFTRNFREHSPVVESYAFVEANLGGAGVWDVILPAPAALDWDYLAWALNLETRLRREAPGLTKVISLADAVVASAPSDPARMRLAVLRQAMIATQLKGMEWKIPSFYAALYGVDPAEPGRHYLRIMLRARERQSAEEKLALIDQVTRISQEEFARLRQADPDRFAAAPPPRVTGFFVLLTSLVDSMLRDQWLTFSIALAGIAVMLLFALRSLKLALVAMFPNALPILVVMGLMGWLGLKINMGAAMIAAVSLGLSVDSSLHYLLAYRRARRAGKSRFAALQETQQTVGRALVFATLALVIGFSSLCFSEFVPTIYFGALVSLAMLGGLAGNLVLLPLLLRLVEREKSAPNAG